MYGQSYICVYVSKGNNISTSTLLNLLIVKKFLALKGEHWFVVHLACCNYASYVILLLNSHTKRNGHIIDSWSTL